MCQKRCLLFSNLSRHSSKTSASKHSLRWRADGEGWGRDRKGRDGKGWRTGVGKDGEIWGGAYTGLTIDAMLHAIETCNEIKLFWSRLNNILLKQEDKKEKKKEMRNKTRKKSKRKKK